MPRFLKVPFGGACLLVAVSLGGCTPSCERVCTKVLACDLDSDRVAQSECEDSCERQAGLYVSWEDEIKQEAMDDHLRCLVRESCASIEEGACYDDLLFDVGVALDPEASQTDTAAL